MADLNRRLFLASSLGAAAAASLPLGRSSAALRLVTPPRIPVGEWMPAAPINNAMRQIMADLRMAHA